MLYFLQSINTDKTFYLIQKNEFIVGRKSCDILIENDSSISRAHAKIYIKDDQKVTIEDLKAKYKTFINGNEITPNVEIQLNNNDKVKFGGLGSIFEFHQLDFVTTATQLSVDQKEALKTQLNILQGKYLDNWNSQCTHLTLEKISLTVKVLHALLEDKPIVVPAFWAKFADNVSKNKSPPNITKYNDPPLAETLLNKVEFKKASPRKNIFKGKHFFFYLTKEEKQVKDLIEKAGGTSSSWDKNPIKIEDLTENHLVMQSNKDPDDKNYEEIIKHISKQNKRTIPMSEIAMAIIHGSCRKDCNPKFNRAIEVFKAQDQGGSKEHNLLVHNTQTQDTQFETNKTHKVIPETVDPYQIDAHSVSKKIKMEEKIIDLTECNDEEKESEPQKRAGEDLVEQNAAKKVKLEETDTVKRSVRSKQQTKTKESNENQLEYLSKNRQSQKRKATVDSSPEESPAKEKYQNPFMVYAKKSRTEETVNEQPLQSVNENINPFLNCEDEEEEEEIKDDGLFSSTQIKTVPKEEPIEYSRITRTASDDLDISWHSKKNCSNVKIKEIDEFDSELQSFIKLFESKISVEVLSEASFRSRSTVDQVDCSTYSNCRNFKKFKKVKPIYPQKTVIGPDSFRLLNCTNTTGINDTRRKIYDSDEERPTISNPKQNRKAKCFNI